MREEYPECFATTSSSVSPQFREFERFTTTAMNAFIGPKVRNYVTRLEIGDRAPRASRPTCASWRSNGGVATPAMVAERPVLTLLSGPGGRRDRRRLGGRPVGQAQPDHLRHRRHLGRYRHRDVEGGFGEATARDTWIAGFPVLVPMIDIHTIGAGGGSIAYRRPGRRLPGRAAQRRRACRARPPMAAAATEPTVTDANVVLGRLDRDDFLGGGMTLDEDAARRVIGELARRSSA